MSGNHEPPDDEPSRKNGKWKTDKKAPIPRSTRAYWKKTGRYPEIFRKAHRDDDPFDFTPNLDANERKVGEEAVNFENDTAMDRGVNSDEAIAGESNVPTLEGMVAAMDVSLHSTEENEVRDESSGSEEDGDDIDSNDCDANNYWINERNAITADNEEQYIHLTGGHTAGIQDIVVHEDSDDPKDLRLYSSCRVTQRQSEMMHVGKALRFNNCEKDLEAAFKCTNLHLPYEVREFSSLYFIQKNLPQPKTVEFYYCAPCKIFINFGYLQTAKCNKCHEQYDKKVLKKHHQYFISISLEEQFIQFLGSESSQHLRKECEESDIVNAEVYKEKRRTGVIGPDDLSLTGFLDGVVPHNHTQYKMWPLAVSVNELPYRFRKNNIFLCGVWYGKEKPIMNLFLKPFVDELKVLQERGLRCKLYGSEIETVIKVHLLLMVLDTPAKSECQCRKSYNARFGCPYCLNEGVRVPSGRGHARAYVGGVIMPRNKKMHMEHLKQVVETGHAHKGVAGPCILMLLKTVDIIFSFVPEYMHCGPLGVVKMFLEAWFLPKYHGKPFYLGHVKNIFNERMTSIKPTSEITRLPAEFGADMKASQMRNVACYYSLPCLKDLMKEEYYQHIFLFVYGFTLCLRDKVSDDDRRRAKEAFDKFVSGIEELYGKEFQRFNAHLFEHITEYVRLYGAFWAWSAFYFEHFNGVLAKCYHGTQSIAEQMARTARRLAYLRNGAHIFNSPECDPKVTKYFLELTTDCNITRIIEHGDNLRVCIPGKESTLSPHERQLIENEIGDSMVGDCTSYQRFIYKKRVFTTSSYSRAENRNNHMISTSRGELMKITNLVCVRASTSRKVRYIVLGQKLVELDDRLCEYSGFSSNDFSKIVRDSSQIICCDFKLIEDKFVCVPMMDDKLCLIPIVNRMETD